MKKSLLALAVLGVFAGSASAQSSVTLYGTLDVNGRYVKNTDSKRRVSLSTDGINSSQLGFRGVEDLGGGLKASFVLLAGTNPDSGTTNAKFFNRKATVSVQNNMGELRLGRDYTPTFWNQTIFDAFGTNGVGNSLNVRQLYGGTRMDNTIGYFLPGNLGGWYGQAMVAASEGGTSADRNGRYVGARFGFAAGPFDIAFAASQQRFGAATTLGSSSTSTFPTTALPSGALGANGSNGLAAVLIPANSSVKQHTYNIGGSWDFGFMKLLSYYDHERVSSVKENVGSISAVFPFGQNEVHVGYDRSRVSFSGSHVTVDQIKATYMYNLSKRTALYTSASHLNNHNDARNSIGLAGGANASAGSQSARALPSAGGSSNGVEFGIRHFF